MSDNLFLCTLYVYWEKEQKGKIITNLKLDEDTNNSARPHKAKVSYRTKAGKKGVIDLVHQQDCTWTYKRQIEKT